MRGILSEIENEFGTQIRCGEVFVPTFCLSSFLGQFVEPAMFLNEETPEYQLSISGCATKIRIDEFHCAIVSRHQVEVGRYDFKDMVIFSHDLRQVHSSNMVVMETGEVDEDRERDALIYDFSEQVERGNLTSAGWFCLRTHLEKTYLPNARFACTVTLPGAFNFIDYNEREFKQNKIALWGEPCLSGLGKRLGLKLSFPTPETPVGISGSPVFAISEHSGVPSVFFAGVVTNASRKMINFISKSELLEMYYAAHW